MGEDIMDKKLLRKVRTIIEHYNTCKAIDCAHCKADERLPKCGATICTLLSLYKEYLINELQDKL